jgi:hypothetical protein
VVGQTSPAGSSCKVLTNFLAQSVTELIKSESAASLPIYCCGNTALLAFDDLFEPDGTVRLGMLTHFDTDVSPTHLVSKDNVPNDIATLQTLVIEQSQTIGTDYYKHEIA